MESSYIYTLYRSIPSRLIFGVQNAGYPTLYLAFYGKLVTLMFNYVLWVVFYHKCLDPVPVPHGVLEVVKADVKIFYWEDLLSF